MTMTTTEIPVSRAVLPARRRYSIRLHLLGRSVTTIVTSLVGLVLFVVWIAAVALAPISITAPLLVPITAIVRAYADAHRRGASWLLGTHVPAAYRSTEGQGVFRRIVTIVRDPASWRDAAWLLLRSVVGSVTSILAVALFASSVFYLIYPFLYWVTPQRVFGRPFGDWHELHSVADATVMMPVGLVMFGLWMVLQVPLTRLELTLTGSLLGPRRPTR
jgi:hypothetical protein